MYITYILMILPVILIYKQVIKRKVVKENQVGWYVLCFIIGLGMLYYVAGLAFIEGLAHDGDVVDTGISQITIYGIIIGIIISVIAPFFISIKNKVSFVYLWMTVAFPTAYILIVVYVYVWLNSLLHLLAK